MNVAKLNGFIDDERAELRRMRHGDVRVLTGQYPDGYTADMKEHRGHPSVDPGVE